MYSLVFHYLCSILYIVIMLIIIVQEIAGCSITDSHKISHGIKRNSLLLLFEDISKAADNSATKESSDEGKENAEDDKEKAVAATKIQAAFRGHHARKSLRVSETASKQTRTDESTLQDKLQEEFPIDDQGERSYALD